MVLHTVNFLTFRSVKNLTLGDMAEFGVMITQSELTLFALNLLCPQFDVAPKV